LEKGVVKVHPDVRKIMNTLGEDGWIAATFPEKWGGDDMPVTMLQAVNFIFCAANYSASVFSNLTTGAAKLLYTFGSDILKETYLPPMLEGKWQGTMALTEPEAGSSLGDLKTMATPLKDGAYLITGEKIFISAGDHDGADNIVHLMLARIEDSPAGVKGISLFVVPKKRWDSNDKLVDNDVIVSQIFHKMGYKGAPITGLTLGENKNCKGYLVGEANKGLIYMFQMMNTARLDVGTGATAIATASYHSALDYVRSRKQGRKIADKKAAMQVPIIEHNDVKRMLLFQRAICEGSLALIMQCGLYEELTHTLTGDKKEKYHLLLEILTPVAKTFPSEMSILSTSQSIQCFGGYGYCDDFPVEQHFRDTRIHPIHEGTTGIQGMDLLGRKIRMQDGKALSLLIKEIEKTIERANPYTEFQANIKDLDDAVTIVCDTTKALSKIGTENGEDAYLANATIYLEMFGFFIMGWLWLSQAMTAKDKLSQNRVKKADKIFYEGKIKVHEYYFANELPKIYSLARVLTRTLPVAISTDSDHFTN
jgi:alkylation response protein AidB-like acyl-CoA dehydrogenase